MGMVRISKMAEVFSDRLFRTKRHFSHFAFHLFTHVPNLHVNHILMNGTMVVGSYMIHV